ncbi:terpene utilization protein AtuA [Gammaproteobacteria bacterium 45_16_T64]|nr:terpene utilization protein AtuA [Gammaproteobacteria bacterium 45_16_T64]
MNQTSQVNKSIKIGCASAFWGDTQTAAHQLVKQSDIDYLVFDYLAEVTMSIMAGAKMKNPEAGYATDFVSNAMAPLLSDIANKGIKVISNAGGINPSACASAIQKLIDDAGLNLTVATVMGDNLTHQQGSLQEQNISEMFSNESLPPMLISMNAYLGAPGILTALQSNADIIITGRVVDSAVVLAPLMHEFGWSFEDYDKLAQGSLAGHIIECGTQCTGGNFTDWETVPDFHNMGFPVIECFEDGSFITTKPDNTGGIVTTATVAEQLVYEIGDPRAYYLPDVVCDFTDVHIEQLAKDRVHVSGAKGHPPTDTYKVSSTYPDGFRITASFMMGGINAQKKADVVSTALLKKVGLLFAEKGLADFTQTSVEILGTEATYGKNSIVHNAREVVVKIAATHVDKKALGLFSREIAQASTAMAPGLTGLVGGRPKVSPVIRLFSFLYPKKNLDVSVVINGERSGVTVNEENKFASVSIDPQPKPHTIATHDIVDTVPLYKLAYARSGDKGNHSNIGVIARQAEFLPAIQSALTESTVSEFMAHVHDNADSHVSRWQMPGINGMNFMLENSLGGGGIASLRIDAQGKAYAQQLLEFPIPITQSIADQLK